MLDPDFPLDALPFHYDTAHLINSRITLDKFRRGKTLADYHLWLEQNITLTYPFLLTQEFGHHGTEHYHLVAYCEDVDYAREALSSLFTTRGFTCVQYDGESNNRKPEYYFGYILKDQSPNSDGNIITRGTNLPPPLLHVYRKFYLRSNVKTADDCLDYVRQNYGTGPYDEHLLINTIVDYYRDTKKVYDKYIILRRAFHMCRLALFEDVERENIIRDLSKIIDG